MRLRSSASFALPLALALCVVCTDQARKGRGQGQLRPTEADKSGFAFPNDEGGALLAKMLSPRQPEAMRPDRIERPRRFAALREPPLPTLPLPSGSVILPRLPVPKRPIPTRPRPIEDETLAGLPESPSLPDLPAFPVGRRVRIACENAHDLIPLPLLARPALEPAAINDPTAEASAAAARSASIPSRTAPAPFLKLTLPDPYERRRSLGVPATESEPEASATNEKNRR